MQPSLWSALDPEASRPKQIMAALTSNTPGKDKDIAESGVDDEIRGRLEKLLSEAAVSGQGVGETFLQINRFFSQQPERKQVYDIVRSLAKPYPHESRGAFRRLVCRVQRGIAGRPRAPSTRRWSRSTARWN